VADKEDIFAIAAFVKEMLKVAGRGLRRERSGDLDGGFVAGLGADERGCLQASLQIAGDDDIELNIQCVQDVGELEAVALAVFIEGAPDVEKRVSAAGPGARMAEDEQVHGSCFHGQFTEKSRLQWLQADKCGHYGFGGEGWAGS